MPILNIVNGQKKVMWSGNYSVRDHGGYGWVDQPCRVRLSLMPDGSNVRVNQDIATCTCYGLKQWLPSKIKNKQVKIKALKRQHILFYNVWIYL